MGLSVTFRDTKRDRMHFRSAGLKAQIAVCTAGSAGTS